MGEKNYKNGLVIISLIFGILGLILAVTPLRMFGLYPAGFAVILLIIDWLIRKKRQVKLASKGFVWAWAIALGAIILALALNLLIPKKVAEDEQFQQKIEQMDTASIENEFQDVGFPEDELDIDTDSTAAN